MLKIANDSLYNHPLKENHRFPMIKYELIPEQLLIENTCNENNKSTLLSFDCLRKCVYDVILLRSIAIGSPFLLNLQD